MSTKEIHLTPDLEGKFLLGNHVIKLEDETKKTFETDNMAAFESFLADKQQGAEIYYSATDLYLVPVAVSKNSRALAHCKLAASAALTLLLANAGKGMGIVDFEKFLTALRAHVQGGANMILSHLRNFSVAKKQTYERAVDNAGNFKMLIQRESAGTGDWVPPATLTFVLPVFKFVPELITLEFDFHFTILDEGAKPFFTLLNLNLDEQLADRRREIVETRLGKAATCPTYWGASAVHVLDDGWKYRENKASL